MQKSVSYDVRSGIFKACRLNIQNVFLYTDTTLTPSLGVSLSLFRLCVIFFSSVVIKLYIYSNRHVL
jgi:hypothetical protein